MGGREEIIYTKKKRREDRYSSGVGGGGLGLKLDQKKVLVGHSKKMMDVKDITKILAVNIAALFRGKADVYSLDTPHPPSSCVHTKRRTTPPDGLDDRGTFFRGRRVGGIRNVITKMVQAVALQRRRRGLILRSISGGWWGVHLI